MKRHVAYQRPSTHDVIDRLFLHPPATDAELEFRLKNVNANQMRQMLMARLEASQVKDHQLHLFTAILGRLGIGPLGLRLARVALDAKRAPRERVFALLALTSKGPEPLRALATALSPSELSVLTETSLLQLFVLPPGSNAGEPVATVLREAPSAREHMRLLDILERCRRQAGVSAAAAYGHALASADLTSLHNVMLAFVVEESSAEGIQLLERLRDQSLTDEDRRTFQRALLRACSRAIDPALSSQEAAGHAYMGSCDGQGAYILLACFENPGGSVDVANLCIRAGADVRDGFILPRFSHRQLESMMAEAHAGSGSEFVKISLEQAAALVKTAVKRTLSIKKEIPAEARPSIEVFSRIKARLSPATPDGDALAPSPGTGESPVAPAAVLADARCLLSRPEYESWFFEPGDLSAAKIVRPRGKPTKKWYADAARRLDTPETRQQLAGMLRHMGQWHQWRDEASPAALCRVMAWQVDRSFLSCVVARAMLERSLSLMNTPSPWPFRFGDPVLRQHFKASFFASVDKPTGADLARLDFTEVTSTVLQAAFDALPSKHWPREQERMEAAFLIGSLLADDSAKSKKSSLDSLTAKLSRALKITSKLPIALRKQVVTQVLPEISEFIKQVCASCPIGCLDRPNDDMSEVFFTADHPTLFKQK